MSRFPIDTNVLLFASSRLGDQLITMVVAYNLYLSGVKLLVFADYIYQLRHWFPWCDIRKAEAWRDESRCKVVNGNFICCSVFEEDIPKKLLEYGKSIVLSKFTCFHAGTMVDAMSAVSKFAIKLDHYQRLNGIIPIQGLSYRLYHRCVLIHPLSQESFKEWLPSKFLLLAREIKKLGFSPKFVVPPLSENNWCFVKKEFEVKVFSSISEWAAFIYQSGYVIGNDSGGAHLASCLNIPSLVIAGRETPLKRWVPDWFRSVAIFPERWKIFWMPTRLKQSVWKYCLTVKSVSRQFKEMI